MRTFYTRTAGIISIFFLAAIICFIAPLHAQASSFSQSTLRLDRLQTQSPISGLVCAQPSSPNAGTEHSVSIAFPTDFSISLSALNWEADTANIPAGTIAWPGISTYATKVSGTTVTFDSSDLTGVGTYCFSFVSASSTTGEIGSKTFTLTTSTNSGALIDSQIFEVTIISSDQTRVDATVAAKPTDFQAQLQQLNPSTTFPQNYTIEYELTYSSHLSYPSNIIVQASWTKGTIAGNNIATEDILQYEPGSADEAYNYTQPVIDPQNRTITWTIPAFPGNTQGKVKFKLKTTDNYLMDSLVYATVTGRILGPGTQSLDSTKTITYKRDFRVPPPNGGSITSAVSPAFPSATPTPMPSQSSPAFSFRSIQLKAISSHQATIETILSEPTKITLQYGTSLQSLTKNITILQTRKTQDISIDNLQSETAYYFRIIAISNTGKRITSDIFTFTTARTSQPPKTVKDSIIVSSLDNVIFDPKLYSGINTVIIGRNSEYKVTLKTTEPALVSSIKVYLANPNVLGITNFSSETHNIQSTELAKISSGVFSGTLQAPSSPTSTMVIARIMDTNGNIVEEPLFTLKTVHNFSVLSQTTKKPIEDAAVYLSRYDPSNQLYTPLLPQASTMGNPSYTESNGQIILPLPPGTYKAEISAIGYRKKTVDFTLGQLSGQEFPTVYLTPAPFSIITFFEYYGKIILDTSHTTTLFAHSLISSNRFIELFSIVTLISLSCLLLYAVSMKFHIAIIHLPNYLWYHIKTLLIPQITHQYMISGQLVDSSGSGIGNALVYIKNAKNRQIISHTKTNSSGEFYFTIPVETDILLDAGKNGYRQFHSSEIKSSKLSSPLQFRMDSLTKPSNKTFKLYLWHLKQLITDGVEVLIIISLALEMFIGFFFGWLTIIPHLIISLASFILLLSYIKKTLLYSEQKPLKS